MKKWILIALAALTLTGCQYYSEKFEFEGADGRSHQVDVTYVAFLSTMKASDLKSETQTEEFIREVNTNNLEIKTDGEALDGVTEGFVRAITRP